MSLRKLTLFELQETFTKGEVSAAEIVRTYFQRIGAIEPKVRAFITTAKKDTLLAEAEALDRKLGGWRKTQPLMAMPIAVKDNLCTEGVKTTCGSRILEHFIPPYDATVVARMRKQEYILIGKANLDEFAFASFDVIVLNHVFEHVSEPRALLKKLRRLLTPGGVLFLEVPNAGSARARLAFPFLSRHFPVDERSRSPSLRTTGTFAAWSAFKT